MLFLIFVSSGALLVVLGYTFWLPEVEEDEVCVFFLFLPFLDLNFVEQFEISSSGCSEGISFLRSGVEFRLFLRVYSF